MGTGNQSCMHCRAEFPAAAKPRTACPLCGKPLAGATGSLWHYARAGRAFGPVSSAQLRELAAAGLLLRTDLVQRVGSEKWLPATKVKNLFEQLPAAAPLAKAKQSAATEQASVKAAQPRPAMPPAEEKGAASPAVPPCVPAAAVVTSGPAAGLSVEAVSRQRVLSEAVVVPDAVRCVQCGCCSFNCPIGIDVRAHAWRGVPIEDSHCLTCSECVKRCPRGVLSFEVLPVFKH